jgi:hypothetical protein
MHAEEHPRSRIVAGDKAPALLVADSTDIALESLALEAGPAAVIEVRRSTVVRIDSCLIQVRDQRQLFSPWPAVFVEGKAVEVEGNSARAPTASRWCAFSACRPRTRGW